MSERVRIQRDGGVAHVELIRPDKLNALDEAMIDALIAAGESLRDDPSLRCVVLSGEGRAFCAGLDVQSFMAMAGDRSGAERFFAPHPNSPANRAQQTCWVWRQLPVPVIAAVHGVCFGGGLQIALAADLRLVTPDVRMSVMEIKWGLIPDMSGSQTLRDLVRLDVAKELTFTGREVGGEEAVRLGLATRIVESPREAALEMARAIAGRSPDAIRASKRLLEATRQGSVEDGLALEAELQRTVLGAPNQIEAVMAAMQKREPSFADPKG